MITMDKKYKTRSGRPVRLLCVDGCIPNFPVVGFVGVNLILWMHDGKYANFYNISSPKIKNVTDWDLVEVKPRVKRTYYINIYDDYATIHDWRTKANKSAIDRYSPRLACVEVQIDCEEGEGLLKSDDDQIRGYNPL